MSSFPASRAPLPASGGRAPTLSRPWRVVLHAAWLTASIALPASSRADWVTLHDGSVLRGVDFVKEGSAFRLTLENGRTVRVPESELHHIERSPPGERIEWRGRRVTLAEKVRRLQSESRRRTMRLARRCEEAARGSKEAATELDGLDRDEASALYRSVLRSHREPEARLECVRRLARLARAIEATGEDRPVDEPPGGDSPASSASTKTEESGPESTARPGPEKPTIDRRIAFALAQAGLVDPRKRVRHDALSRLAGLRSPDSPLLLAPFLRARSPHVRMRAASALERFPDRRVAKDLVEALHLAWTGFGRAYIVSGTERAYVADYELVSSGTGFSVVEVADPVVRTARAGVILDVDIQRVEQRIIARTLRAITGETFGPDPRRWRRWLEATEPKGSEPRRSERPRTDHPKTENPPNLKSRSVRK